jgi:hypothetical protein
MPIASSDNIQQWGGTAVSAPPATGIPATGSEIAPVVKPLFRRNTVVLNPTLLGANATYTGPWYDTNITGDTHVYATVFADQGATSGGFLIYGTDDTTNTRTQAIMAQMYASTPNTATSQACRLRKRYWRIVFINGSTAQTAVFQISFNTSNTPMELTVTGSGVYSAGFAVGDIIPVSPLGNVVSADAQSAQSSVASNGVQAYYGVAPAAFNGVTWDRKRTPSIWRGNQFSGGANVVWTPPSTKKVRLMKYKFEISEDATITGGPLPVNLAFSQALGTANSAALSYPGFGYTHRVVLPASVLATSGQLWESDWVDLGNGQLLTSAGASLIAGIQVPQTTAAVNPTWTIAANQWEAATIGFKTNNATGNFKLVQQLTWAITSSVASIGAAVLQTVKGNAVYVIFRTTNTVGGAPTVVVTDTAANTYTTSALTTNATDGTYGSSLGIAYCTNVTGLATNTVTLTTSVNLASQIEFIYLEYSGMGTGGIDAALVSATGNSTAPASGNYTPGTAGDLILSFFATAASLTSQPTSSFVLRGAAFTATQGALAVADNFGNGALATGQVNAITIGTEE